MSNKIQQYLRDHKYNTAPDEIYSHIDEWLEWYQGEVRKFHKYKVFNGVVTTEYKRYSMGMAKKLCEDWANLILNEKVSIKAGDYEKRLNEILEANNFRVRGNQLLEMVFALGTGAFVEYRDASDNVIIDYIRADMIYPLSWDNGDITECVFGTTRVIDGKENIYLQIHRLGREEDAENPELYYIENRYIEAESGKEIEPPEEIEPLVRTGYEKPLFQVITPNICNNIDLDSPLGISIYANCISQLKGCDLIYDSYVNEFILGRKRILVPISAAKMQMQKEGVTAPVFDASDSVYYQMPGDRHEDMKLTEVDMAIRAQEHELGMQRSLDILSQKAGMGTGRYQFDSTGVKTATEVISDKSDLYQNLQRNEIPVKSALISMIKAVAFLDAGKEIEPTVDFDDSIIEDSNTTIERNIKLIQAGLRSKLTAIMEIDKCSEADAKKEMERIAEDNQITGQDMDWTKGDMDEQESEDGDAEEGEEEKKKKTDDSESREKAGPTDKK